MALDTSKKRNMRVLALHGHRQSGDIFAKKTSALKKILTSMGVTFIHYPTAPHKLEQTNDEGGKSFPSFVVLLKYEQKTDSLILKLIFLAFFQ
jgi:ribulose 1,5-bisphosphate carboxylase large subunit-like protein